MPTFTWSPVANNCETQISQEMTPTSPGNGESLLVGSTAGFPASGYLDIDGGNGALYERIWYSAVADSTHFTLAVSGARGADGTIARRHLSGAPCQLNFGAAQINEMRTAVEAVTVPTATRGAVMIGDSTPAWSALALGTANKVLQSDGTDAKWSTNTLTISGNSTINGTAIVGTPGTITSSSTNSATDPHTHEITASSNVSAGTSALLKSASGALSLASLAVGTSTVEGGSVATFAGAVVPKATATYSLGDIYHYWSNGYFGAFRVAATGSSSYIYIDATSAGLQSAFIFQAGGANRFFFGSGYDAAFFSIYSYALNKNALYFDPSGYLSLNSDGNSVVIGGYAAASSGYLFRVNGATESVLNNATTNTVDNLLKLGHNTTGTPAQGFGSGLLWTLESSTTADQTAALDTVLWTDATHATRTALRRDSVIGNAVNTGYTGFWNHSAVAGTALTVIPNATGDVTSNLTVLYSIKPSTGTASGGVVNIPLNADSIIWSDDAGANTLTLTVAADGSVTIARSAGAYTYGVALSMVWI